MAAHADQSRKRRLLVVGDAVASTGFARLTRAILERLCDRYEVHQLGVNFHGDPHDLPWKVYPAGLGGDIHGVGRLAQLVEWTRPDIVWMVNDVWVLADYAQVLDSISCRAARVAYVPVDSGPVEPTLARRMQSLDQWVAFTEFGRGELLTAAAASSDGNVNRDVLVIPLGVDQDLFRPGNPANLLDRQAAKQALFPSFEQFPESTFVVLNANRNQPRKRIDLTMEAFAIFARDKPAGVKLYLHMGIEDLGWNLPILASRLGIERRLIVTHAGSGPPSESSERLNLIYNACDVGVNTATGEGWGLVAFEHAATGAPQVVPRHTSLAELWNEAGVFVETSYRVTNERTHTDAYFVEPHRVAQALERLYVDEMYRRRMSEAAYRCASHSRLAWDAIAGQWDALFHHPCSTSRGCR
ncbi:MAG: glycosyltransferase [Pirellulales bacterium]